MAEYLGTLLTGLGIGVGLSVIVFTKLARKEHLAWKKLCDEHWDIITTQRNEAMKLLSRREVKSD